MFRYLVEGDNSYLKHIKSAKDVYKGGQRDNQYKVDISMQKPLQKNVLDNELLKGCSITFDGIQAETVKLGSVNISRFSESTPLKVDLIFHEMFKYDGMYKISDDDLYSYFFMKNNKTIQPKDGTSLLPYDWYFQIDIYSLQNSTKLLELDRKGLSKSPLSEKPILSGEFIIDNSTKLDWLNKNSGENQEIVLSFVPIMGNSIKRYKEIVT